MINVKIHHLEVKEIGLTGRRQIKRLAKKAVSLDPLTLKVITTLVMIALLLVIPAGVAHAQAGGDISTAFSNVVTTITDIIQSLAIVVGILGVTLWGFGKVARPVFPELSQLTQQYIGQFVIGIVVVYVAATVVEGLAAAVSGA